MKAIGWTCLVGGLAVILAAAGVSLGQGLGGPVVQPPRLAEDIVASRASDPVVADTNALAALAQEEATLMAQAREIDQKIAALSRPLWEQRQRVVLQDPELVALTKAIAEKQKELEAKIVEKYPEVAAKAKERDQLTVQYHGVNEKLRDTRRKLDATQEAIRKLRAEK